MKMVDSKIYWSLDLRCTGNNNGGGGCKSLLRVEDEDIYVTIKMLREDENRFLYTYPIYCYTFKCPCCNIETDIDEKEIPFDIRKNVLRKYRMEVLNNVGRKKEYE